VTITAPEMASVSRMAGQRRAGVNQFSPRSIRYSLARIPKKLALNHKTQSPRVFSSELTGSQKNAMLDPDTHYAWKQREFWYFVLIFLSVIGFLILLGNAKPYF
jgi:hypothetical protein